MENLKDFKCPNCGGALSFDNKTQKLKCPYCDGTFDPGIFDSGEGWVSENVNWDDNNMLVYECRSCGGTILADKDTAATHCPYCGNPVVLTGNLTGAYRPSKIIPFKLDKKDAMLRFSKHLKGKLFLPNEFKQNARVDEAKGLYVPYWLFNGVANVSAKFHGEKVISRWSDYNYRYTKIGVFDLFRQGRAEYANIPADASSKMDDTLSSAVEPFDYTGLKEFNENYLSGYLADKYDVSASTVATIAEERMIDSSMNLLSNTTWGYSNVYPIHSNSSVLHGKEEYVMLPLWILSVRYNDEDWIYAMNGQTGRFVGNLPCSKLKVVLYSAGVGLLSSGIIFTLLWFLSNR